MTRISFNEGWQVQPKISIFTKLFQPAEDQELVRLPHDAMLDIPRVPDMQGGPSTAYFPGGAVEYRNTLDLPEDFDIRRYTLEFQGVYRDAMVFVNGAFAGQCPGGYTTFHVALDAFLHAGTNHIRVEARAHQDSRWYSGLGIHRDVVLIESGLVHLAATGPRVRPEIVDDSTAMIEVMADVLNESTTTRTVRVAVDLLDADADVVGTGAAPVTVLAGQSVVSRQRIPVHRARRWSVENPYLYRARVRILDADDECDAVETTFGVRTVQADPIHGLRINGEVVKLRGACVHHDNGVLGAAAPRAAEDRRIRLLKGAGFNAIRAAHNPLSQRMLDACDRLGMLVMDEAFDMWTDSKSNFDQSITFPTWWESDLEAMVHKDYNHPSVIMYSIGNEVLEAASSHGALWARKLAEKVRGLDDTRLVTNGVSGNVGIITQLLTEFQEKAAVIREQGNVNDLVAELHDLLDEVAAPGLITGMTEEIHSVVDVVGHNYDDDRYAGDLERFPHRVVVGTESLAPRIDLIWDQVMAHRHVIGDFTWTGWDYIGEVGIGRVDHVRDDQTAPGPHHPWLLAWCGDIDITGYRRPASYFREMVFGLRTEPYIAVARPAQPGTRPIGLNWSWTDTLGSWTFDVEAGTPMEVEVYSDASEVELFLNGRSLGVAPAGSAHRYRARFEVDYEPGELVAVARRDGVAQERTTLKSAGPVSSLRLLTDRLELKAADGALGFVEIELVDGHGILSTAADRQVRVRVEGDGELVALGSANPVQDPDFGAAECRTFEGRAMAVVRPTGPGTLRVRVSTDGLPGHVIDLHVEA
ncbi:glycoside hydrolase family 2 protein [Tessaracoccus rhinocerotis]|uniref:Glycoside hydrolase family 2 protein n=1 Tax=Tessaracoccus rhinocerotis TaxID=1689449 RepID=A0A553JZ32_9ACTN|nr:glycoside hydrolase family 2 TIM barrel-domain containing protein [Tessaracoccus rhinocerotis]TRY17705.1 glycoside hydrolase family 2 protein [Tessaracoccus rhinocerotis]